jgi:hypothetical protein
MRKECLAVLVFSVSYIWILDHLIESSDVPTRTVDWNGVSTSAHFALAYDGLTCLEDLDSVFEDFSEVDFVQLSESWSRPQIFEHASFHECHTCTGTGRNIKFTRTRCARKSIASAMHRTRFSPTLLFMNFPDEAAMTTIYV